MKQTVDFNGYNTLIQPTEWRFSAAIVGLVKYLKFYSCDFKLLEDCSEKPPEAIKGFDGVLYHSEDITKERYLKLVEKDFESDMTHITILNLLKAEEFDDELKKRINKLAISKKILESVFGKEKFNGSNKDYFIEKINENKLAIIESIFINGENLYKNYCHVEKGHSKFFIKDNQHCRLNGYYVDKGRKTRFLGFCFSKDSYCGNDIQEFDFIPFAFSNSNMYETFFINNNFTVKTLLETDSWLKKQLSNSDKKDSRERLFTVLKNAGDFLDFDVEIISKSNKEEFYKTMFVRYESLQYIKSLEDKKVYFIYETKNPYFFNHDNKINNKYYFNLEKIIYEYYLNNLSFDELIIKMLKLYFFDSKKKKEKELNKNILTKRIEMIIDLNVNRKGNENMDEIQNARKVGFLVSQKLIEANKKNKINSYRQKITSALVAHDYDRVKEILLSLSSYVDMEFKFLYKFLENAEENKDVVFSFTSALIDPTLTNKNSKGDNK